MILGCALLVCAVGCGRPFDVKTATRPAPANYNSKATLDSISVEAQAVTDEDFLYDNFDANLISAGVIPVRVRLTNSSTESLVEKDARFELEAQNKRYKAVEPKKAFKRLISYYGISAYSKSGYRESLDAFGSHALDLASPLPAGESRQGLVFFLVPVDSARQTGLTLFVDKLGAKQTNPTSLKLN
jgi:hypothetical protein